MEVHLRAGHRLAQRAVHQRPILAERRGIETHRLVIARQQVQLSVFGHKGAGDLTVPDVFLRPAGATTQQAKAQGGENEEGRSHVVFEGFPGKTAPPERTRPARHGATAPHAMQNPAYFRCSTNRCPTSSAEAGFWPVISSRSTTTCPVHGVVLLLNVAPAFCSAVCG